MFCFSLARELHMTVRELLLTTDAQEIAEWAAFFELEREAMEKRTLGDKAKVDLSQGSAVDLRKRIGHLVKKKGR